MSDLNNLLKKYQKEEQNNYIKALNTPLQELCENFKIVFDKEKMMKSDDVYKWTEINFDKAHKVNVAGKLLAIHASIYKEHREKVFNFMIETVKPKKIKNAFYFNPKRDQLSTDKLKKHELIEFNTFKEAVSQSGIMVKDLVYSKFLSNYIYAYQSKLLANKNNGKKHNKIGSDFNENNKSVSNKECELQTIKDNFFSLLKYFVLAPDMSQYVLIILQGDKTFPIFEEFYDELLMHGADFSQLIYCWSDASHMPINRFAIYNTHPKTIDFLVSKGLPVSVYISSTKQVKIKTAKDDVIKGFFKSIKYDYDWQEKDKEELKTLFEKQKLEQAVLEIKKFPEIKKEIKI